MLVRRGGVTTGVTLTSSPTVLVTPSGPYPQTAAVSCPVRPHRTQGLGTDRGPWDQSRTPRQRESPTHKVRYTSAEGGTSRGGGRQNSQGPTSADG